MGVTDKYTLTCNSGVAKRGQGKRGQQNTQHLRAPEARPPSVLTAIRASLLTPTPTASENQGRPSDLLAFREFTKNPLGVGVGVKSLSLRRHYYYYY